MYPYNMSINPFPSSPTPTLNDVKILGGEKHKEALYCIKSCIEDSNVKLNSGNYSANDLFKIITIIQDVGSGKTHLSLHMRTLPEINDKSVICYVDLSQVHPREIDNIFNSIIKGFDAQYFKSLQQRVIEYIKNSYNVSPRLVKKVLRYGFFDKLNNTLINDKINQLIRNKIQLSFSHLQELMNNDFSQIEIYLISEIMRNGTLNYSDIKSFDNLLLILSTLCKINHKFFNKVTIFQIDEFDANLQSLDYVKGLINSHIPNSILMLITTPSFYNDISRVNPSLFDRLEKANYKIDLAGSNSFDEIKDIMLEYITKNSSDFKSEDKKDLTSKLRVIYDEFPDFRNIRSILNILYHATESSFKKNSLRIDEKSLEETIKNVYPGLRLRGSIMGMPISDFIKMRKLSIDRNILESSIKDAVRNLINYVEELGTVKKTREQTQADFIDAMYNDQLGKKIGVTIAVDNDKNKNFDKIINSTKRNSMVDKLIVLTTNITNIKNSGTIVVTVDKWKMADLLYFSKKYANKEIKSEDPQKAIQLAKSIQLC
ncbi:MAG: hypothetical protein M3162_04590 [Thermoproteota archaeon]|nr:hypothetical protein [Thermoproteota archaeon]